MQQSLLLLVPTRGNARPSLPLPPADQLQRWVERQPLTLAAESYLAWLVPLIRDAMLDQMSESLAHLLSPRA